MAACLLPAVAPDLGAIDGDGDGVSDVWARRYGASGMAPGDDPDGDGQDNRLESMAGTDPFDPLSRFASVATADQTNLWVGWFGVAGKRYEVWYSCNLVSWERFGGPFVGAGTNVVLGDSLPSPWRGGMMWPAPDAPGGSPAAAGGIGKFFRVQMVPSVDWEGDGLDAYEESLLGTSDESADSDGDGIGDHYEFLNILDPTVTDDPFSDPDGDRLMLVQEHAFGTSERTGDTDGDGWSDYHEYFSGTDPRDGDSDDDGIGDFDEDFDGDGLTNRAEVLLYHTDPLRIDTDLDDLGDHEEVQLGLDPLDHGDGGGDLDGDGLTTAAEIRRGSDPACPDSDGDGIVDGVEVGVGLNPLLPDSDGDGVDDGEEDTDGDGLTNAQELALGTDMGDPDTDDDGIGDGADPDSMTP